MLAFMVIGCLVLISTLTIAYQRSFLCRSRESIKKDLEPKYQVVKKEEDMEKSHCIRTPLQYGVSSDIGRRPQQQDDYVIRDNFFGLPDCYLFAVFDGHGSEGGKVSGFAKKMLPELLLPMKDDFLRDPILTLKNLFSALNAKLNDTPSIDTYMSGTTAVVV
ncbi:hypothetical protein HK096_004775, partial [Nowakowskiella sp. JEL0078]